jgi:hypothetical protein|tara:strand:+ start:3202 stop:3456 length:255 start_codon:yes stop_codon:yes gene_type:complete
MSMKMQVQLDKLQARVEHLESLVKGDVPQAHKDHHQDGNEHVGPLRLKHKGRGFWDVVSSDGVALNGGRLKKSEAEEFIATHAP